MKKRFTLSASAIFTMLSIALSNFVFAQTNPTPQAIPYTQDFSSFTGSTTTYTAGWQGWDISGSLGTSFPTTAPTANRALTAGTNAINSGVVMDMNGKLGIMATGSSMRSACLSLNTSTLSNIQVSYLASTQRVDGVRINAIGLQYRVGTVGSFTNVSGSEYQNTTTGLGANVTGTGGLDAATKTVVLPSDCNNQAEVQIRWVIRDVSGTGNRQSFSIDDISVIVGAPAPEINILVGAVNYANNSTYSFGTVAVGGTYTVVGTVQNTGSVALNISNATATNFTDFTIVGAVPPYSIAAGSTQTYTMSFVPTVTGTFTNILGFISDDADESTYTVTFTGVAVTPVPEINIVKGATNYLTGSTYNVGTVNTGSTSIITFTVQNLGTAALNITSATFTGGAEYTLVSDPLPAVIAPSGVFTVTFVYSPTVVGTYTETLTLYNNDADENPYVLNIKSVVTTLLPEINIRRGATNYLTGDTYNFANTTIATSTTVVFTIQNTGTGALNITGNTTSGALYTVNASFPSTLTIAAGSSTTFSVTFAPTLAGTYSGSITFTSNDADEATYILNYSGVGQNAAAPEINILTTALDFGSIEENTATDLTYVVQNTGTANLTISTATTAPYTLVGTNATSISAGNSATYTVRFQPTTTGTFTANVTITSNDADEPSLIVTLTGIATTATPAVFTETFGLGTGTTAIPSYGGWSSSSLTFTGSGDIRSTTTSSGYFGATAQGNAFLTNTVGKDIEISDINTSSCSSFTLAFGIYKSATTADGSSLAVEVSTDGVTYTPLTFTLLPSGAGTVGWYYRTATGTIPSTSNLRIRFTNTTTESQFRIDDVQLKGICALVPEINIKQGGTNFATGSTYNFVNTTIATSTTVVFTIQNSGTAPLNITSNTPTGALYTVNASFPSSLTIAAGNTATFSVTFAPTAAGTYSGSITFTSNDADEATYVLNYSGIAQNAPTPEINIVTTALDFGSIEENTTADLTYVVQNTGASNLTISTSTTAPYSLVGTNATTISAGNSATYTVRFSPTTTGTFTANVTITSNDADEPSLTVTLTGIATVGSPVVFTETFGSPSSTTLITSYSGWSNGTLAFAGSGDVRTSSASTYTGASGSGNVFLTNGGTRNIIISNINTSACTGLSLSFGVLKSAPAATGSDLIVEVSADGTTYTALTFPALPAGTGWNYVTASGTIPQAANLRIRFTNTSTSVQYRIDDVKLKGSCGASAPEINVKQATTSIASGGSYDFGVVTTGSKSVVFTIENTGAAALAISSSTFTGAQFSLVGAMPTSVAAGSSANFTVQFTSSTMGSYSGSVTLVNTDANEGSYVVNFTASVPTSIEKTSLDNAINMFPNPNNGTTLYFNKTVNATIYNAIGAKVIEVKNSDSVDVSTLENGIYMVNINNKTKRLIITK